MRKVLCRPLGENCHQVLIQLCVVLLTAKQDVPLVQQERVCSEDNQPLFHWTWMPHIWYHKHCQESMAGKAVGQMGKLFC